MSADMDNMLAKLQMQLASQAQPQPSLFGLQAQQDPNTTAALLKKLQDQAYVQQQGNDNSEWGFINNAGKKDFARAGQGIGNLLGIGQPQQYDNSGVMQQRQAITAGNQSVQQDLANGVDPQQAKINALQKAVSMGYSAAGPELQKAVEEKQKTDTAKATAYMDTQKGNAAADEIPNRAAQRALDQKKFGQATAKDTWTTIGEGNGYIVQKNGLGEISTKKNQDAAAGAAASLAPGAMGSMIDYYKTTGQVPPGIGRSPAIAGKFWDAVAQDSAATGDMASAVQANKAALHSNTQALTQTQKQLSATQTYLDTMDKNIEKARTYGNQLDFSDAASFNKALASWNKGTSDPTYAKYALFFDAVANESAKIKSGSLGNVAVSDSMRHETAQILNSSVGNGGMNAVFDALKDEGNNRVESLAAQRDDLVGRISKRTGTPGAAQAATSAPGAVPPPATVPTPQAAASPPPAGWTLHTDAKGNKAYVSPDGKQFQEAQ